MYREVCLFLPQMLSVLTVPTHEGMARLSYVLRWFTCLLTVAHPSTNWAWRCMDLCILFREKHISSLHMLNIYCYL